MNSAPARRFAAFILFAATLAFGAAPAYAKTYYISQSTGNDNWNGQAETQKGDAGPWKSLAKASSVELVAGDRILLKSGDTWDDVLRPKGSGTATNPIVISSYGEGKRPLIDRGDYKKDQSGIHLADQEGFKISGLEFANCMTGIYGEYAVGSPNRKYLWIENCFFRDSLHYQRYHTYPKAKIGLGICLFSHETKNVIVASDITVKNCEFRRLASGIWTNSPDNFNKNKGKIYNFANFVVEDCLFEEGYQWPMGMRGVDGGAMRNCLTIDIGRNFLSFNGVAGSMFSRCKNWVFEDSEWCFISIGKGSGDGQAFDFESNCDHMRMKNCSFHDTDGPCFLLCCYASGPEAHKDLLMENCVLNGKSKRPIRPMVRSAIFNTTDWNEAKWKDCRFYLSKGEVLMYVADPEKDKRSTFENCVVLNLATACTSTNLAAKAKATASSEVAGFGAAKVNEANAAGPWKAQKETNEWVQLDFATPVAINEFKLKEDPSSKISRYTIECWDDKAGRWVSCFNGIEIGADFVAPIVPRTTSKARLLVHRTAAGVPAIASFEAYLDTTAPKSLNSSGR